jgi:hypothetical protein
MVATVLEMGRHAVLWGSVTSVTKKKPGFWTRQMAFEQVRSGSNIHLLSFSLVCVTLAAPGRNDVTLVTGV